MTALPDKDDFSSNFLCHCQCESEYPYGSACCTFEKGRHTLIILLHDWGVVFHFSCGGWG